jgi:hypothetical protein
VVIDDYTIGERLLFVGAHAITGKEAVLIAGYNL